VVDKPAGLALHPTARYHVSTLTWALEQHHSNSAGQKPDPAHRSIARPAAWSPAAGRRVHTRRLKAAFAARQVEKAYLAVVEGSPPEERFDVELPLRSEAAGSRWKVRVDAAGAPSLTSCQVCGATRG